MEIRRKVPCSIIRGGTSRGLYFMAEDLPENQEERDLFLLRAMGSPDKKQIDGLGGAVSVTSKVAIIKASKRPDADVDYTFAQVSVDKPLVSYKGNCGNISSGVGPFAIEKGLVEAKEPVTEVRVYNTNTDKVIVEEVQVRNGQVQYTGDTAIAGVPGTAAKVGMRFLDPAGSMGKGLLPTGKAADILEVPDFGKVEISIVDASNPLVFVRARDLGFRGDELPAELNADTDKLELLEKVRGLAAVKMGLITDYKKSAWETPGVPKMTFVTEAMDYISSDGSTVHKEEVSLVSRMMSMQKPHPAIAMTGAICTAAAAAVPGSIVAGVLTPGTDVRKLRIGHPSGVIEVGVSCRQKNGLPEISYISGYRTANYLLEGYLIHKIKE